MENSNTEENEKSKLYENVDNWTKEQVRQWAVEEVKIDKKHADILFNQDVTGAILRLLKKTDLVEMGITHGPALHIIHVLRQNNILPQSSNQAVRLEEEACGTWHLEEDAKHDPDGKREDKATAEQESKKNYSISQNCKTKPLEDNAEKATDNKEDVSKKSLSSNLHPTRKTCMPHPFDNFREGVRYIYHNILNFPETGPLNLIDPAHEFKLLTNTDNSKEEDVLMKFSNEVFRFAAACMNSRTNGTIHFGVHDNPHGQIEGIKITNKQAYINHFNRYIEKYFWGKFIEIAKACIRQPRFVEVLSQNGTSSDSFVIEIDIVPEHSLCDNFFFEINTYIYKSKDWNKAFFIRDGASSKNIVQNVKESNIFKSKLTSLANSRKSQEEAFLLKQKKLRNEGLKLESLLTGNKGLLDDSYYDYYILVTNKCDSSQVAHLDFLQEIKWFAVLDFDFESEVNGVFNTYQKNRNAKIHFPEHYENREGSVSEHAEKLSLHQETNWIFCNGRSDSEGSKHPPLDPLSWQKDRAADVRKMISFLLHKDVKQSGKFLVVFLVFPTVEESMDLLTETFMGFYQELKGLDDMLCICIGPHTYQRWKDLLCARHLSEEDLSAKCIFNLTLEMVNGTITKLKSVTHSSVRLLPSASGSTVLLKKEEDSLAALEILCINECKDTEIEKDTEKFQKFLKEREEDFYRGGKVSWWNFYFSSENYTSDFIKRDGYEKLQGLILSSSNSTNRSAVEIINLYHHPGCGGTTLAMHMLWDLRKQFRCAVLKNKINGFETQLTTLITYGTNNSTGYTPVLLLVDDFEDQDNVYILQKEIQKAVAEKHIHWAGPLVIILNCMRSQNPDENSNINALNSVSLKHLLSLKEQRAFDQKLKDIEKQHSNPNNFYSFMIMKKNFDPQYIKAVVKNTLNNLDTTTKQAKLVCYLALLNSYVNKSTVSISLCEEFLGTNSREMGCTKDKLIEKIGICSNILIYTQVEEEGSRYRGLRIIHPRIASHCLTQLKTAYNLSKSEITLQLLKEDLFYETPVAEGKLTRDIQTMLISRHRKEYGDESDTLFAPLIEDIGHEEKHAKVIDVFQQGSTRFKQNALICQALARYFCIREKNFDFALDWAKKAKKRAPDNSYISNTLGQVYKRRLRYWLDQKRKSGAMTAEQLKCMLELAQNASQVFRESQQQAENAHSEQRLQRLKQKRKLDTYNTAGYMGEIETCLHVVDVLEFVPMFSKDQWCRKQMARYLSGKMLNIPATDSKISEVLALHSSLLSNLQSRLKRAFNFMEDYFVFFKTQTNEREIAEARIFEKVQECFTKYTAAFCDSNFEQLKSEQISRWTLSRRREAYRDSLEASKADSFSGLLEYLHKNRRNADGELEDIVDAYEFLCEENPDATLKEKQNLILANVVLKCLKPKSTKVPPFKKLRSQLLNILEKAELPPQHVEPFFLASFLFWPENPKQPNEESKEMARYVTCLYESFKRHYGTLCHAKLPLAHFYLGKGTGLNRFVHKGKINQLFSSLPEEQLNCLWQSENIWKEKAVQDLLLPLQGRAEGKIIYADYGSTETFRIPVHPVPSCMLEKGPNIERVSFYLGFSIAGLQAYNTEICH